MGRRLRVFSIGMGVGLASLLQTGLPAVAQQSESEKQEIRDACARYSGEIYVYQEADEYVAVGDLDCTVARLDEQCEREYPDWEMFPPYFDVVTEQCEEGCFLTTACVELIGLEDDCFELRVLRKFRDERLAHLPGGREEIARYYDIAPRIVRRMAGAPDAKRDLSCVYATMVLPSVAAALLGQDRLARWIYRRGTDRLSRKYLV